MGVVTTALARVSTQKARKAGPGNGTTALASFPAQRRIGKTNPQLYRNWSTYNWAIRAGFDLRRGQIERAEYDLVQYDRDGPDPDRGLMRRMREVIDTPNPGDPSFGTFIGAITEDILTLDAGCIEKERMVRGEIAYIWPTDGGAVKVDRLWSGNPRSPRYYYCPDPQTEVPLLNSDLTYLKLHNLSHSPVGISYLETLRIAIEAELALMMYNVRTVRQAAPDGIMDLGENARKDQVESFKAFWDAEIAGQGMMSFWGGTKGAKFIDFHKSNVDMQLAEFYELLVRIFCAVMQIHPQDIGFSQNVNKANGEVIQQNTENRGFLTLAGAVQDYITSEIVWDPGWGGRKNNIAFRFDALSDKQNLIKAQTSKLTLAGMPSETVNEYRISVGKRPIGDPLDPSNPFNKLMANTAQGLVTLDKIPTAFDLAMRKTEPAGGSSEGSAPPKLRAAALEPGAMVISDELTEIGDLIDKTLSPEDE